MPLPPSFFCFPPAVINVEATTPNRASDPNSVVSHLQHRPLTLLNGGGSAAGGDENDDDDEQLSKYKKAMMHR